MNVARLRDNVQGLSRLGSVDALLFVVSWCLLGLTRLIVVVLPQSKIRYLLGEPLRLDSAVSPSRMSPPLERRTRRISDSISRAARHTPWRSECLPQALTARAELIAGGIAHTVNFGLRRNAEEQLLAHAWVRAADIAVTGGDAREYQVVGSFGWKVGG